MNGRGYPMHASKRESEHNKPAVFPSILQFLMQTTTMHADTILWTTASGLPLAGRPLTTVSVPSLPLQPATEARGRTVRGRALNRCNVTITNGKEAMDMPKSCVFIDVM